MMRRPRGAGVGVGCSAAGMRAAGVGVIVIVGGGDEGALCSTGVPPAENESATSSSSSDDSESEEEEESEPATSTATGTALSARSHCSAVFIARASNASSSSWESYDPRISQPPSPTHYTPHTHQLHNKLPLHSLRRLQRQRIPHHGLMFLPRAANSVNTHGTDRGDRVVGETTCCGGLAVCEAVLG